MMWISRKISKGKRRKKISSNFFNFVWIQEKTLKVARRGRTKKDRNFKTKRKTSEMPCRWKIKFSITNDNDADDNNNNTKEQQQTRLVKKKKKIKYRNQNETENKQNKKIKIEKHSNRNSNRF